MKASGMIVGAAVCMLCGFVYAEKGRYLEADPTDKDLYKAFSLRSLGPALTSGRIADFAVREDDPRHYYVAVASGGVWVTHNAGTTWKPVFDQQGSYSIGCVTLDPGNHHTVWVGTGENNNQRSVAYGDGVYKSLDGGETWKNMGLKDSEHISRIIVHPENSDVVYAAAYGPLWSPGGDRGVFRTTDGGEIWERILYVDEHTGIADMVMDPRDPDVLYAAAHQRRRHVFTYVGGGPGSALYKSTDGGATWVKSQRGLPDTDLGRIGLAISPVDPDYVYAIVEAADGKSGFFRSVNRGASWQKMSSYVTSGNYYQEIVCDPADVDRVYAMDVWLHFSDDGGKTFQKMNERWKHVDNHAMWIDPRDPDHYIVGCDGGIYVSRDRAATWRFIDNLPVTQFYKIAADNAEPFYYVYGGTQDNFTLGGPSRTINQYGIVNGDWFVTASGDGFKPQVDPRDPDIIYSQAQYGNLYRYEKSSRQNIYIKPVEGPEDAPWRWNWDAPLIISPHEHKRLYFAANVVFRSDDRGDSWTVISPDLTRQRDRNTLEVMDKVWSMDAVGKNGSTSIYGNIVALDESPLQGGLIYAGTDDGLIQVTENAGGSWRAMEKFPGIPQFTYVNSIVCSRHEASVVYAAFNNHKNGDFKPYILKSQDKGKSWKAIHGGLPERGSVYSIAEDHIDPNLLFAGTEFGLFFSIDGGGNWVQLKRGLPTVAVRDLAVQRAHDDLVVGTFGRGIYVLDDYAPLREVSPELLQEQAHIFPVRTALAYMEAPALGYPDRSFQGDNFFAADNPEFGAMITYYLRDSIQTIKSRRQSQERRIEKAGDVIHYPPFDSIRAEDRERDPVLVFTIRDEGGSVVRRITRKPGRGICRLNWDLRYPRHTPVTLKEAGEEVPWSGRDTGPMVVPGSYSVEMASFVNGAFSTLAGPVSFEVESLGLHKLVAEDRDSLLAFQRSVASLRSKVLGAVQYAAEMDNKLQLFHKAILHAESLDADLLEQVEALGVRLADIKIELSGDASISKRNFEVKPSVSERLNSIVSGLWESTSPPTGTMRSSFAAARGQFVVVLEDLQKLADEDIARLEQDLQKANAPFTPGRLPELDDN
jgi:photosystem II stability/assembly factor-like uncharacterized protein